MNALSNLKCISSDNKVILNSSSTFSGNFNRSIIDFMNDEEKLLITFKKDTVGDTHIAASEGISLINITATPNLRMEEQQQLTLKGYMSERVTVYDTFNETKVSTSCLISTESSTNNNSGSNDAISSVACEKYHNGKHCLCSFLMKEIKFLRGEINFKNEIIKNLFASKSMLDNKHFFLITQSKIKSLIKTSIKELIIQRTFCKGMLTNLVMIMT